MDAQRATILAELHRLEIDPVPTAGTGAGTPSNEIQRLFVLEQGWK